MESRKIVNLIIWFTLMVTISLAIPHPIQISQNNTKCAYSQLPTGYLPVGKTVSVPGDCMQITCLPDLTITGLTCPTYYEPPGCTVTDINYYAAYPDCCPQIMCENYAYANVIYN